MKSIGLLGSIMVLLLSTSVSAIAADSALRDRFFQRDRPMMPAECAAIAETCANQAQTCKETAMGIWEGVRACMELAQGDDAAMMECKTMAYAQLDDLKLCFTEVMECRSRVGMCLMDAAP